ncbi:peptide chain release factor N(5)-glutamine methyltransferase [Actinomycetospora sp. TBRC 11914]|uniref:peptide chain release factor N(5)-glutamine methyltransferase n=1 Tax=Actinomycetospora sp. TBRC 11914 TaxID=2729387 RepID=UPI00145D386D|nr:peptide chain release factor N(5)-glutamine methyltransferase [Actinomycetospora sp. TBRC 11914]NMO91293.1 peptide chain release factor N(5)-glutamine methyltransferase [Actinomycetospora sp. TBRC 11914]
MTAPTRTRVADAAARLAEAGVESPRVDAELLAAHVLGVPRTRLVLAPDLDDDAEARLDALVARRAAREPLQHLVSSAVLGPVSVAVGPGVFVPRPETELLLAEAVAAVRGIGEPRIVDLCTGSGALALAIATTRPDAEVHAVELDPGALAWARRNLDGSGVRLTAADVTDPATLATLEGRVDVVVANPPYVPEGTPVAPEVDHDPHEAVFAGPDGLAVVRPLATTAARLLRDGGRVAVEHDESHAEQVREVLEGAGFADVGTRADLAGRPRMSVGTRRRA